MSHDKIVFCDYSLFPLISLSKQSQLSVYIINTTVICIRFLFYKIKNWWQAGSGFLSFTWNFTGMQFLRVEQCCWFLPQSYFTQLNEYVLVAKYYTFGHGLYSCCKYCHNIPELGLYFLCNFYIQFRTFVFHVICCNKH